MFAFMHKTDAEHKRNPIERKRRIRLLLSYLPDWLITIILAALFFALDIIPGFKRDWSLADTSLQHPYTVHERISNTSLALISVIAPFVIQGVVNLVTIRSYWDFHNATLGLILALATSGAITQFSKVTVGRPRPDVISRCMPPPEMLNSQAYGLVTVAICTQTNEAILRDGWRSFPSGHSSLSFAGLGFLSFYISGKLHLFDQRGFALKTWIALTPIAGALMVAISRTMDYRHHWHDVVAGSILGLVLAYFSYRQYFPSLASDVSHRPYSPRIMRFDNELPTHTQGPSEASSEFIMVNNQAQANNTNLNPRVAPPQRDAMYSGREDEEFESSMTVASNRELLDQRVGR